MREVATTRQTMSAAALRPEVEDPGGEMQFARTARAPVEKKDHRAIDKYASSEGLHTPLPPQEWTPFPDPHDDLDTFLRKMYPYKWMPPEFPAMPQRPTWIWPEQGTFPDGLQEAWRGQTLPPDVLERD